MSRMASPSGPMAGPKPAAMRQLAKRAKEVVRSVAPDLKVESHWGHEWFVGADLICVVGAFSRHVGVEFWRGSILPDPDHLLEGTGKNLRHVKLRNLEEASATQLARLVGRAVKLDQQLPKRKR